jgi:tetrapyrrole methylase family protein/MazG family protein
MGITIVGLGPGDGRYLTREAWEVLAHAPEIWLRTRLHPAVADLPAGAVLHSFDALYEASADFQPVYAEIVQQLLAVARDGRDVVYAVPGSPGVAEATVPALVAAAAEQGVAVRIVEGLSFLEPTLTALGYDALDGLQLLDAITLTELLYPPITPDLPLLLGQVYSPWLASALKLTLMAVYPPEHTVQLVHAAGSADQRVESVPLYAIDRSEQIHNLTALFVPPLPRPASLSRFAHTIAWLRSPQGCPWDREQTPQSLRDSFQEEVAELLDALDRDDPQAICEELGDVLLHLVMQAQMAAEADDFTLSDVIAGIEAKIRRRHPHVWGEEKVADSADLTRLWSQIKAQEKPERATSLLDNIPLALPALARAQKIQRRAARVGFDWPTIDGVWATLVEELDEVRAAISSAEKRAETGDLLFSVVNLARWLEVDAETALREALLRFSRRFAFVEAAVQASGKRWEAFDVAALDQLWQAAKSAENKPSGI